VSLALGKLAPQRLCGRHELARELLQTLDLLAVALADVLEVGLQALNRSGRPAASRVCRRQPPQRAARKLASMSSHARQGPGGADIRSRLIVDAHRRSFDYRPMSQASARLL
jgi:hypothetical protein